MGRSAHSSGRRHAPAQDLRLGAQLGEQRNRLVAFICVLGLYLAFAGTLIGLGYGLWPALAGATTACVVAGEVARRVITAGTAPAVGPVGAAPGLGSGLADLLGDISRALERGSGDGREF
jgi:hypothetical protein